MPYAEISTRESFAVVWLICRVVILSNLARAKFRLHALLQRIFPLGRCPLCRGPPLKGTLVLPLPKAFYLQGADHAALHGRTRYQIAAIDPSAALLALCSAIRLRAVLQCACRYIPARDICH